MWILVRRKSNLDLCELNYDTVLESWYTLDINCSTAFPAHHLWQYEEQASPSPRPWMNTGLWPVKNQATQQGVSARWASEASSAFIAAPYCSHYCLSSTLDPHRSVNSTVNCACKGSRLHTSDENLMSDNLILHYSELYNYFIMYHNVIIIKYTKNIMHLNHPETISALNHGKTVFHEISA